MDEGKKKNKMDPSRYITGLSPPYTKILYNGTAVEDLQPLVVS